MDTYNDYFYLIKDSQKFEFYIFMIGKFELPNMSSNWIDS
jgi:hypothetical protein